MDVHRVDELMEPLGALPDRLNARHAIPLTGEETTELGQAADSLTQRRRSLRRGAAVLHSRNCRPRARFEHHCTRDLGIRSSRPGDELDTPRNHERERDGMQQPLLRLQPSLLDLPALLEHPDKAFYLPAAPLPLHHRPRTGAIHHREACEQQPFNHLLSRWRCDLLRLDGCHCHRW